MNGQALAQDVACQVQDLKMWFRRPASVSECPGGTVQRSGEWYCGRQRSHSHGAGRPWAELLFYSHQVTFLQKSYSLALFQDQRTESISPIVY